MRPLGGRRLLLAGLAGGLSLNLSMILTFRVVGFGWDGGGVLLDPTLQSPKLVAVWTELEPLPKVYADPVPIVVGLFGFGVVTPFNLFGEPALLLGLELVFWLTIAGTEAISIAVVCESDRLGTVTT